MKQARRDWRSECLSNPGHNRSHCGPRRAALKADPLRPARPVAEVPMRAKPTFVASSSSWPRLQPFDRFNVERDNDSLVVASNHKEDDGLGGAGISLLMRNVRRKVDEVAWPYICHIFEPISPTYLAMASHDVDRNFMTTVVMCPGVAVRSERDRADPGFTPSCAREVKRGRSPG